MIVVYILFLSIIRVNSYTWVQPISSGAGEPTGFGAHYIKLDSTVQNGGIKYSLANNAQYTYTKSLTKSYTNLVSNTPVLSSFHSDAVSYFGFDITSSATGNPVTSISLILKIQQNSSFFMFGFSIICIAQPMDQVFLTQIFYLNSTVDDYQVNWGTTKMPNQTSYFRYLISFNGSSQSSGSYYLDIDTNAYPTGTYVRGYYDPDYGSMTKMKLLLIVISLEAIYSQPQYIHLYWEQKQLYKSTMFASTTVNVGIDSVKFGTDFRNKCFIGITQFYYWIGNKPFFKYNIDSTGKIVNGSYGSFPYFYYFYASCYTNLQCPSSHPYKVRAGFLCYDCPSNYSDTNCLIYEYGYVFNTSTFVQTAPPCIVGCRDCQDHYYFKQNDSCRLCNELFIDCITCYQNITCLTCVTGKNYNPYSRNCQTCNESMPNCVNCTNYYTCTACNPGKFFNSGTGACQSCTLTLCQVCATLSSCTTCMTNISYKSNSDLACYLCYTTLTNCINCSDQYTCTYCTPNISLLDSSNNCQLCSNIITNCFKCSNNTTCTQCNNGSLLNTTSDTCDLCNLTLSMCINCISTTICTQCQQNISYLNTSNSQCQFCNVSLQLCLQCSNKNTCLTCQSSISYLNLTDSKCKYCNYSMPFCVLCADQFTCTQCQFFISYLNSTSNLCQRCNSTISFCLECSDPTTCTLCVQNITFLDSSDSKCYYCNTTLTYCQNCSDIDSCTKCVQNITYLDPMYEICDFCNVSMTHCLLCHDKQNCFSCQVSSWLNTTSHLCQECNATLPMCLNCTTYNICTVCTLNISYLNLTTKHCQFCNVSLNYCIQCSNNNTCLICQSDIVYLNTTSFRCLLCNYSLPLCINCSNSNTCTYCEPIISFLNTTSNQCQYCNSTLSNCLQCSNSMTCTLCQQKYYVDILTKTCKLCRSAIQYCSVCSNNTYCDECYYNYSTLKQKCIFMGCQTSYFMQQSNGFVCTFCETPNNFQLINGNCTCKAGYFLNYSTEKCQEICGDGLTYDLQCDDGNKNQIDGCNYACQIMPNYVCNVNQTNVFCKYKILLQLEITQIFRLQNKSAIITVKALNNYFPFQFQTHHFISSNSSQKLAQIDIVITQNPLVLQKIQSQVIYSNRKQIQILIFYSFDIQGRFAQITFNTSKTRYICQNDQIKLGFRLKGSNGVLKILNNPQLYQGISYGTLLNTLLTNLLLLTGLFSKKFIGLECVLTLQLIYYSQLLIEPSQNWPVGFQSLYYLKYANGYNINLQMSATIPKSSNQQKFAYLFIKKLIIQNCNINFLILFGFYLVFIILKIVFAPKKVNKSAQKKNKNKNKQQKLEQKQILQIQQKKQKIIDIGYNALSQISMWLILQVLSALCTILTISNKTLKFQETQQAKLTFLSQIQLLLIFISLLMIFFSGLNSFSNFYLSESAYSKLMQNPQQLKYKRLLFIYIIFIGFMIFFCNQIQIYGIKMSVFIAFIHFLYTIAINLKINPYQKSLKIHQIVLFMQHMIYLIFLILINLINFIPDLQDMILIAFGYLTTISSSISIVLTIIRLYYQYRFGQILQIQLKKQQQARKIEQQKQKEQKLKKKCQILENKAKQKLDKKAIENKQNSFLYENKRLQNQKSDLLQWLQNRNHLTKQQKQEYYFQKFEEKPINWIKQNDPQKYQKIMQQRKAKKFLKKSQKTNEPLLKNQIKHADNKDLNQIQLLKDRMINQYKQKKQKKQPLSKSKYLKSNTKQSNVKSSSLSKLNKKRI